MILIINAGSSSLKLELYDDLENLKYRALIEKIGDKQSIYIFNKQENKITNIKNHHQAFLLFLDSLNNLEFDLYSIKDIVHRVVHGGEKYTKITAITKKVEKDIEKYSVLAPLHNPINLELIRISKKYLKHAKNWAVFDTAFYVSSLKPEKYIYALNYDLYKKYKIRKYGFHGISHQYILEKTAEYLNKKVNKTNLISCHLGSGASITAIENGKAIDTSMGFTPLAGIVMRTRSGDIDPGILIYLMKNFNYSIDELDELLNKKSGFYGLSSFTDMREILQVLDLDTFNFKIKSTKENKERAKLALNIFLDSIVKYISYYYLSLKKVDAIVLTAGIGSRSKIIYKLLKKRLKKIITKDNIEILQIATNEELMMYKLLKEELNA